MLTVIPVIFLIWKGWGWARRTAPDGPRPASTLADLKITWLAVSLSGATLLAFSTLLVYLVTTMRYLADMVILATLTSTLGFFLGLRHLADHPGWRRLFVIFVILLTLLSVVVAVLLAITGYEARFEKLNPALFDFLTRWLTP